MRAEDSNSGPGVHGGVFATTHWSVILAAGERGTPEAAAALEQLCRGYWYPLYVYIRRRGYSPEDAQDLAQEFFAMLLQHEYLRLADPKRGRFRTFLLHALEHFIVNQWKRASRLKRGGGATFLHLDVPGGEQRYAVESSRATTPAQAYEKRWALTLLDHVLASLRQQYTKGGKARLFEELAGLLWGRDGSPAPESYAAIGQRLGMTEGAVRVAVHRLRERYRGLLTQEVAKTVATPEEVEQELRYLLLVVSRKE